MFARVLLQERSSNLPKSTLRPRHCRSLNSPRCQCCPANSTSKHAAILRVAASEDPVFHLDNGFQDAAAFAGSECCVNVGPVIELDSGEVVRGGLPTFKESDQSSHKIRVDGFQPVEYLLGDPLKILLCILYASRQLGEQS